KMEKMSRVIALEQKFENRSASADVEIESAIHELELLHTPFKQPFQPRQQRRQGNLPNRNIQRREAKFTSERTPPRCFDVNNPIRHILLVIQIVRQHQPRKIRKL